MQNLTHPLPQHPSPICNPRAAWGHSPLFVIRLGHALARLAVGTTASARGARAFGTMADTVEASASVADMMDDHTFYLVRP